MAENVEAWSKREQDLIEHIASEVKRLGRLAEYGRQFYRALTVVSLVCTVLAPVAVVSSAGGLTALGMSKEQVGALAVVLTVVLGLSEGLRRGFRFEQRWAAAMVARVTIQRDREIYRDNQVDLPVGSKDWVENLKNLRAAVESATQSEMKDFFDTVKSTAAKEGHDRN